MILVQTNPKALGTILQKLDVLFYEQTLLWVHNTNQSGT